jgi:hypothetical protein
VVSVLCDLVPPTFGFARQNHCVGILEDVGWTVAPGNPGLLDGPLATWLFRFEKQRDALRKEPHQVLHHYTLRDGLRQRAQLGGLLHEEVHHRVPFGQVVALAQNPRSNRQLLIRRPVGC